MGYFIASTSVGYASSLLISGLALPLGGYKLSFLLTCLGTPLAAVVAWITLWRTPNTIIGRKVKQGFSRDILRNKPAMLLIAGYSFHNWELQGMWAWTPAFIAACFAFGGSEPLRAAGLGAYATALLHLSGVLASFSMGSLSDRWGRAKVMLALSIISSSCSFLFGWTFGLPLAITIGLGAVYAFSCIGDSPVFSVALSEAADPAYLGAAYGLRSLLGFGAGGAAPLAFGFVLDWANPGYIGRLYANWYWAFSSLGLIGLGAPISVLLYSRISGWQKGSEPKNRATENA